jgi:tRNA A37 threonylcarbamoyltransferase TsaD
LAYKLIQVAEQKGVKTVLLAGWVSANTRLKSVISSMAVKKHLLFLFPIKNIYSMDNAAMVWILTYYKIIYKQFEQKIGVVKL